MSLRALTNRRDSSTRRGLATRRRTWRPDVTVWDPLRREMGSKTKTDWSKRPARHRLSPAALNLLLMQRKSMVERLRGWVGDADELEDLLHDAYLKVLSAGVAPRDEERVVAWFKRVLRNAGVDRLRRSSAENRARKRWVDETRVVGCSESLPEEIACACVKDALDLVRPAYREILRRVDVDEARVTSVSRELGLTAANARVRLHRARAALRAQLLRICGVCAEHGCIPCTCRRIGS